MMPALGAGGRWFESGRPHISVSISIQMSRNCYTPPFQRCELVEKNPVMAAGIVHRHGTRLDWLIESIDKNFHFLDILLVVAMLMVYVNFSLVEKEGKLLFEISGIDVPVEEKANEEYVNQVLEEVRKAKGKSG